MKYNFYRYKESCPLFEVKNPGYAIAKGNAIKYV